MSFDDKDFLIEFDFFFFISLLWLFPELTYACVFIPLFSRRLFLDSTISESYIRGAGEHVELIGFNGVFRDRQSGISLYMMLFMMST